MEVLARLATLDLPAYRELSAIQVCFSVRFLLLVNLFAWVSFTSQFIHTGCGDVRRRASSQCSATHGAPPHPVCRSVDVPCRAVRCRSALDGTAPHRISVVNEPLFIDRTAQVDTVQRTAASLRPSWSQATTKKTSDIVR